MLSKKGAIAVGRDGLALATARARRRTADWAISTYVDALLRFADMVFPALAAGSVAAME